MELVDLLVILRGNPDADIRALANKLNYNACYRVDDQDFLPIH
jgi:hypothetical protein